MTHPDLETPLGQAWMTAASVEHAVKHPTIEADERLKYEVSRLAHALKVALELIEQLRAHAHSHNTGERQ